MKRFPDIIVVSWQCECHAYSSHSIDVSNVEYTVACRGCERSYKLLVGDLDVPITVIPPRATAPHDDGSTVETLTIGEHDHITV